MSYYGKSENEPELSMPFNMNLLGFFVGLGFRGRLKLIIGVGFCGSLTTFSSWMIDAVILIINGFLIQGFGLIFCTFFLGLLVLLLQLSFITF